MRVTALKLSIMWTTVMAAGSGCTIMAISRDATGNALGGVRTSAVDVPIATLSGNPPDQPGHNVLCILAGHTVPLASEELLRLYPTHQDYVDKVTSAAHRARDSGFVLPEDEATIIADAMAAKVPQ